MTHKINIDQLKVVTQATEGDQTTLIATSKTLGYVSIKEFLKKHQPQGQKLLKYHNDVERGIFNATFVPAGFKRTRLNPDSHVL